MTTTITTTTITFPYPILNYIEPTNTSILNIANNIITDGTNITVGNSTGNITMNGATTFNNGINMKGYNIQNITNIDSIQVSAIQVSALQVSALQVSSVTANINTINASTINGSGIYLNSNTNWGFMGFI